jgi:hydroxymethylpyrimidine pyrophosphatase-like HAD family hydrolase
MEPRKIRLFVSDVDGTLLNAPKQLTEVMLYGWPKMNTAEQTFLKLYDQELVAFSARDPIRL